MTINNKIHTQYDRIGTLLVLAYFLSYFAYVYFPFNETFFFYLGWFFSFCAFLFSVIKRPVNFTKEFIVYFLVIACHCFSIMISGNSDMSSLISTLRYCFIAMTIIRIRLVTKYIKANYYFWLLYFALNMAANPSKPFTGRGASQNFISVVIMVYTFLVVFSDAKNYRGCLYVVLFSLAMSIWTGCRSASIAFGFFLVAYCMYAIQNSKFSVRKSGKSILIGCISLICLGLVCLIVLRRVGLDSYLHLLTMNRSSIIGNIRFVMIREYYNIAKMKISSIVFGVKLMSVPSIAYYDGNPHNAFLLAHANYGLFFVMMLLIYAVLLFKNTWRKDKIYMILLVALGLRSFSDSTAFPGYFDSLFYLLLFEINIWQSTSLNAKTSFNDYDSI